MKIRPIKMPSGVITEEKNEKYGRFILTPLERGFGITIGHALRRMLISSIQGAAITAVKIEGIYHEFSTIPDVVEDVPEIILNIKKVRPRILGGAVPKIVYLDKKGKCEVTAKDIQTTEGIEIVNPDLHIATMGENGKLKMMLKVDIGKGYVPQELLKDEEMPEGTIFLDANFSPVLRVKYHVEDERVGYRTDFEKLIIELWTDGSVIPDEALSLAAQILKEHLKLVSFEEKFVEEVSEGEKKGVDNLRKILQKSVEELELNNRIMNVLRKERIITIADLVSKSPDYMLNLKNFGKKSLNELNDILKQYDLSLGMDVEKYIGGKRET